MENKYHPIREKLGSLVWDGKERIKDVLHHFLGADQNNYVYEAMKDLLLGAISRVYRPGTKFEYMLILVGGQGAGKSTFFRFLAMNDSWFTDDLKKLDDENVFRKMQVFVLGVGSPDGSPIPAEDGSNNFRRDKDGNVIVTRLNEQMCQEIAKAGNGMYIRVDNTNSAEKVLNNEIAKLSKADVESQVYTEFDEQFQALAWLVLILLVVEMLILERKNPLFKNVRLFK